MKIILKGENSDLILEKDGKALDVYNKLQILWNEYTGGHDYVEIGGIKWATMNVGATAVTDTGLYFQWGDTQGYTASQVGSGEGQKYFGWEDYKYWTADTGNGSSGFTKYNSTDGKTVLDTSDDAVHFNWGGGWRMPTTEEFVALGAATTSAWTSDYNGTNVSGLVLTSTADTSVKLFFPAAGRCGTGNVNNVGNNGRYWLYTIYSSDVQYSYDLYFTNSLIKWLGTGYRHYGFPVRGVLD